VGTRTSGSEGGGEQTTVRKRGTAARLRPYIEIVRRTQRNVKRWRSGEMAVQRSAISPPRQRLTLRAGSRQTDSIDSKDENHLALLQLASGLIAFKKAHAARLALAQPG
jgi:hypothetical protein